MSDGDLVAWAASRVSMPSISQPQAAAVESVPAPRPELAAPSITVINNKKHPSELDRCSCKIAQPLLDRLIQGEELLRCAECLKPVGPPVEPVKRPTDPRFTGFSGKNGFSGGPQLSATWAHETAADQDWHQEVFTNLNIDCGPPFDFDCTSVPPSSANDVKPMAVHYADAESCVTPIIAEDAGVDFGGDDAISIISVAARSLFFWFGE